MSAVSPIAIDSFEPASVRIALRSLGVETTVRRLGVGDYAIGSHTVVERKTVRGLHAGIIQGKLWPQLGRLKNVTARRVLLVEGRDLDDGPLRPNAVRGVLLAVAGLGILPLRSDGPDDSARWLLALARHDPSRPGRIRPAYAQRPQPDSRSSGEAMLAAVPGISTRTARALIEHFGSVAAVVAATPEEWATVKGIGPARATGMRTALS